MCVQFCRAGLLAGRNAAGAVHKVDQHVVAASGQNVAQVSNLLYRRFPIGSASEVRERVWIRGVRRLEALRHSRLGNLRYDFVNSPGNAAHSLNNFVCRTGNGC